MDPQSLGDADTDLLPRSNHLVVARIKGNKNPSGTPVMRWLRALRLALLGQNSLDVAGTASSQLS